MLVALKPHQVSFTFLRCPVKSIQKRIGKIQRIYFFMSLNLRYIVLNSRIVSPGAN